MRISSVLCATLGFLLALDPTLVNAGSWPFHSTTAYGDVTQFLPGFQPGDSAQDYKNDSLEVTLSGEPLPTGLVLPFKGGVRSSVSVGAGGGFASASSQSGGYFSYDGQTISWGAVYVNAFASVFAPGGQSPGTNYAGNAGATAEAFIPDGTNIAFFSGNGGQNLGNRIIAGAGISGSFPLGWTNDYQNALAYYVPDQDDFIPGTHAAPIPGFTSNDSIFMADVQDMTGGEFSSDVAGNASSRYFLGLSSLSVGVDDFMYFDPEYANGFHYEILGSKATSFVVPTALPGGDSMFSVDFEGFSVPIMAGIGINFTDYVAGGISSFTLSGLDLSEQIDPNAPGFTSGLTFADETIVGLSMTPITSEVNAVPEPSTLVLWFLATVGFMGLGHHQRKHAV